MTILQQEKEKLAKAREDKPAATEVFGRSEGRTFTIDAKASHNRLALEALATGQLPTFSAATIDVDDLKKELGTYSSQGNSLELMQDIYRGFTSAKFMTPKRAIETYKAVRLGLYVRRTGVLGQVDSVWRCTVHCHQNPELPAQDQLCDRPGRRRQLVAAVALQRASVPRSDADHTLHRAEDSAAVDPSGHRDEDDRPKASTRPRRTRPMPASRKSR